MSEEEEQDGESRMDTNDGIEKWKSKSEKSPSPIWRGAWNRRFVPSNRFHQGWFWEGTWRMYEEREKHSEETRANETYAIEMPDTQSMTEEGAEETRRSQREEEISEDRPTTPRGRMNIPTKAEQKEAIADNQGTPRDKDASREKQAP